MTETRHSKNDGSTQDYTLSELKKRKFDESSKYDSTGASTTSSGDNAHLTDILRLSFDTMDVFEAQYYKRSIALLYDPCECGLCSPWNRQVQY
jgi:hypothetical protein